jgi:O-antigen/teichoic acid export membrane protein
VGFDHEDRRKVTRGVIVTVLGRVASIGNGAFQYVARWLVGGTAFGLYAIAFAAITLLSQFFLAGFGDTVMYFASREREGDQQRLHQVVAGSFAWALLVSTGLAAAIFATTPFVYAAFWTEHDPGVVELVRVMALSLPAMALVRICVDAVKAHLDMTLGVVVTQVFRPLVMVGLSVGLVAAGQGAEGLAWGFLLSHLACVPLALGGYAKYFSIVATFRALPAGLRDTEVVRFAFPQTLNMLFSTGVTRIDGLVLSGFTDSNTVGIYHLVAEWVRPVQEAKRTFVGVFSPLVARYRAAANREGIRESLDSIVRWTSLSGVPLALMLLAFYPEVVLQDLGGGWPLSPAVPWLLTVGPLLSAFFGLAGNLLLMTGHSRVLLVNSALALGLALALNVLLVPSWGPTGAALATAVSGLTMSVLQMFEMHRFEGLRYRASTFFKPALGLFLGALPVAWLTGATGHAWIYAHGPIAGLTLKLALVAVVLTGYAALVLGWPGSNVERAWIRARLARTPRSA